ncbi:MAG: DNA polymerase I [Lachnospiraceae bacterium]
MGQEKKKILLIDGHSILNRAFYGLPDLTNSKGEHTNAVLGFLNIVSKLVEEEKATNILVAFDVKQPTFRHLQYALYKGTRKPMPEELREQVPLMKEVLQSMGVLCVEKGGYEADDIIGTLSRRAYQEGFDVVIVSGDRDLLQLATDEILVKIPKTKSSGTVVENYYQTDVEELYGVSPVEFIDMKGLMGDASDNIPGVPGIGEKTAGKIIAQYHTIENAYEHIDEIKPNKARENLQEYYEQAILSKELATIKLDCELDICWEDTAIVDLYNETSYKMFKRLEFKQYIARFDAAHTTTGVAAECEVVDDLCRADEIFSVLEKVTELGFAVIYEEELLGVSLSFYKGDQRKTYYVAVAGMITEAYLSDRLSSVLRACPHSYTIGLKEQLPYLNIDERTTGVVDLELGAYLCNPVKDTYTYEDIARDFITAVVPGKQEILGSMSVREALLIETDSAKQYIAYQSCIPLLAGSAVIAACEEKNMKQLLLDIEMPTLYTLYDMEVRGIRVNADALSEYRDKLTEQLDRLEQEIYELAGETFNIQSPKQLGIILFEKLKLPGAKKTKSGYSTNVDILDQLKGDYPIVSKVLDYRTYAKLKSTYAEGLATFIRPQDGRIHGKFHQTITATGRISSTEPNLQNIPIRMEIGREIRKVFIPENGYVFVGADYSQIELRVLAALSGDETMIQAFVQNQDIHATTASEVFHVSLAEVTPLQRRNAKAVNFGIVYGISAFGLSQDLSISRKEASEYIEKYFATYPKIKEFLDRSVEDAKKTGHSETMFHRIRPIKELSSSNYMQRSFGERVAMNAPIQGTAADIIKIAMVAVNMRLKEQHMKSRLLLQIHDELLIEAHESEVEQVKQILQEEMLGAVSLSVPMQVDVAVGSNWYEAK